MKRTPLDAEPCTTDGRGAPAGQPRRGEVAPPPSAAEAAEAAVDSTGKREGPTVGAVSSRQPCRPWNSKFTHDKP